MRTLDQIALATGTDKSSAGHNYTKVYQRYLEEHRTRSPFKVLELGVGGYQHRDRGGESIRMWEEYFIYPKITAVDIYPKDLVKHSSDTVIHTGSQIDEPFLRSLLTNHGPWDLIIDDASHLNDHTIETFNICFHDLLKPGGLYFCEDVHTSYWLQEYGGDPDPLFPGSTMAFFQRLTAQLCEDTLLPEYRNRFSGYLEFIHFYRNLVIIKKLP